MELGFERKVEPCEGNSVSLIILLYLWKSLVHRCRALQQAGLTMAR